MPVRRYKSRSPLRGPAVWLRRTTTRFEELEALAASVHVGDAEHRRRHFRVDDRPPHRAGQPEAVERIAGSCEPDTLHPGWQTSTTSNLGAGTDDISDRCLEIFADVLDACQAIPPTGGEEFVLILPSWDESRPRRHARPCLPCRRSVADRPPSPSRWGSRHVPSTTPAKRSCEQPTAPTPRKPVATRWSPPDADQPGSCTVDGHRPRRPPLVHTPAISPSDWPCQPDLTAPFGPPARSLPLATARSMEDGWPPCQTPTFRASTVRLSPIIRPRGPTAAPTIPAS